MRLLQQAAENLGISGEKGREDPSAARAGTDSVGFMRGLKPTAPSGAGKLHLNEGYSGFEMKTACEAESRGKKRITRVRESGRG